MNLTDKHIQDFIDAWKADFGDTLSPEEATNEAKRLLDFFGQMEEGLRIQRRAKDGGLREAWEKMMRKGQR